MAIGSRLGFGRLFIWLQRSNENTLMDGVKTIGVVALALGLVAAILVWCCSHPGVNKEQQRVRARRKKAGPGLQAQDVQVGRTYKLKASAALRFGPQLDSPRMGMLTAGDSFTVKAVKTVTSDAAGTGTEVVRLRCAEGRGWVSLRAKNGRDLFCPDCCKAEQIIVGRSYRVRSAASVRVGAELLSAPADVEFLYPGDWMTVGELRVLSAEESGTGEEVVRLRCEDGRGWVSLRGEGGEELFDVEASAFDDSGTPAHATGNGQEDISAGFSSETDACDHLTTDDGALTPDAIVGSVAVLQNMLSAAGSKLNGSIVSVVSYDERTDRYGIEFQDGSHKAVRLRNLGPPPIYPHEEGEVPEQEQGQEQEQEYQQEHDSDSIHDSEESGESGDESDENGGSDDGHNGGEDNASDSECDVDDTYETVGRTSRREVRYRVVAPRAVIREGVEISSAQVGHLQEGDIVSGWEEMVTDEGHTRLRISENEWVSRLTARGKALLREIDDEDELVEGENIGDAEDIGETGLAASLVVSTGVVAVGIVIAPEVIPGIKLGLAARWQNSGLRYPVVPLGSGLLYGYFTCALGTAVVSAFLRAAALLTGDAAAFERRNRRPAFSGYLALHSSLLVLVAFFSCLLTARVHDIPPTPGDTILRTMEWDDKEGDGDLAAVGAITGSVLALSRWRKWLTPIFCRYDMNFPWWLVVLAGFAGAVSALAMKEGQEGYLQGAARATRAVPYLFYLPAPRSHSYSYRRGT